MSRFHGDGVVETKEHTIQKCSLCCLSPIRLGHPIFLVGIKHTHDLLGCVSEDRDYGDRGNGKTTENVGTGSVFITTDKTSVSVSL